MFHFFETFLRVYVLPQRQKGKRRRSRGPRIQTLEVRALLTAVADNYYGNAGDVTIIPAAQGVLANDGGGNLTAVLVSQPHFGSVTLNADGSFSYTNTWTSDNDGFSYEDYDGTNYSSPAYAYLTLGQDGAAPYQSFTVAQISVVHDHASDWTAPGVLSEMTDPNGIPLTAVLISGPAHGTATLSSDGELVYTPGYHYTGDDSVTFEAYNGNQYSPASTLDFDVTDAAPLAQYDQYALPNAQTFTTTAATGVLANDTDDDGDTLTASLVSQPAHGSLTLNSDGSFSYTPNPGWIGDDSFTYQAGDGIQTCDATATLHTQYSVLSAVDDTKIPLDTLHVSRPILSPPAPGFGSAIASPLPAGGSGGTTISTAPAEGAPATAHNLSLVYDSVLAQPDQVIEVGIGLSTADAVSETVTAALTFNGVAQPDQYFTMSSLDGTEANVVLSQQVDASSLASGRYPWSLTVTSPDMASPATVSGFVNVVNDSASPFGKGWDMPGLYRLFQNNVSGVPVGVLLSTGDGGAWYYTQNDDGSYSSPAGSLAFSTLAAVMGGGWQMVTHQGVTFNFDSSGDLTSRVERTGETTTYNWTGDELTSIVDQFGRTVPLTYSGGLLTSIGDFAGNTWTIAHSGSNLTSVTEPDPGGGAPEWQYAYSGNYMSSVTDPNSNVSSFTLDGEHRLSGTSLPGGAATGDTGQQTFGYGSTDPGNPADLTLESSVVATTTDAMNNSSRYQTDQFGDVTSSTNADGFTTVTGRDANGLPTTITQPSPDGVAPAPVTNVYYDSQGDETYATGAQPTYGTFTYNAFGDWATFTDVSGHEWTRSFDAAGDILSEDDPSGNEVSWTYIAYGRPATMIMPAPNNAAGTVTVHYYYDSDYRLTQIVWPDAATVNLGYDSDDRQTTYEDENSHTTTTGFDALGRIVSVTNALGEVTSKTYDKNGNVLTSSDETLDVVTNQWNSRNELIQQTLPDPDGAGPLSAAVLTWTYNANGQKLTAVDGLGRETDFSYSDLGQLIGETLPDPDGAGPLASPTIAMGYDRIGRQVSETDPLGGATITAYGSTDISQVTSVTAPDPDGAGPLAAPETQYGYENGRRNTVTDSLNHTTTTAFTIDGEQASVEDNLGHTTLYAYGHGGELLTTTNALSHSTSDAYDSRYRLVQTTAADGGVTQITLDAAGNRIALIDPANNETDWTVDALNRPVTETKSLGTATTSYDPSSHVTSIQDADGRIRDFEYDNLHELTAENWMSGATIVATMAYGYDSAGELTSASDPNSAYAFAYNGDGDVTSVDDSGTPGVPNVVLASGFDPAGDRTSLSATIAGTADFLNSFSYDADGRLTVLQQQEQSSGNAVSPKEVDFAYNALGQFSSQAYFNFIGTGPRTDVATGAYSYDNGDRLTGLSYTSDGGAASIYAFGWGYNAGNLVTSFTSNDGEADYGYDSTNQLTSASYATAAGGHQPANESYSFDLNGNRTTTGYTTGGDNLLTSDGTFNYQHDADGNQTVRTRISSAYATDYQTTYAWDYRNRLTDVEYFDNNDVLTKHVHFVYGVFDHLLATEVDSTGGGSYDEIEHYVLDVSPQIPSAGVPGTALALPVLEFDGDQNLTLRNLTAVDRIFAQGGVPTPGAADIVTWMLPDNLGSVRYVLDNAGNQINKIDYNSFGAVFYESDSAIPHFDGFAGGHDDTNTGLVNDYHRWYDPATGRWLSEDPKGFAPGDADLSRYVANNVTGGSDLTGLQAPDPAPTEGYIPYVPGQPYTGPLGLRGAPIEPPPTPPGINPITGQPSVVPPGYLDPPPDYVPPPVQIVPPWPYQPIIPPGWPFGNPLSPPATDPPFPNPGNYPALYIPPDEEAWWVPDEFDASGGAIPGPFEWEASGSYDIFSW